MQSEAVIKKAIGLNFWGKKLDSTRLEAARQIKEDLGLEIDGAALAEWLVKNKPAKEKAAKAKPQPADPVFSGQLETAERNRPVKDARRLLVTSAQNNTTIHSGFFNNLKAYADHLGADLVVLPFHYNTEAFSGVAGVADKGSADLYDQEIRPYLMTADHWAGFAFGPYIAASVNVLPTAKQPVNAAEKVIGNAAAAVVGSTKQQCKTLPRLKGQAARWIWTTGTCTSRHYVKGRAGAEAEADHVFGALLVQTDSDSLEWNIRNIQSREESGAFFDLAVRVDNAKVTVNPELDRVFVAGDIHAEKCGSDSLQLLEETVELLGLKKLSLVVHDLLDFTSRNHHNRKSGAFLASMIGETVQGDLCKVGNMLARFSEMVRGGIYVVESNHDQALDRWLDDPHYDPRTDPVNAEYYYKLNAAKYSMIRKDEDPAPILPVALEVAGIHTPDRVNWLQVDQSCELLGSECGIHGHNGPNGARGNPVSFAKLGVRMVTGHTHSPSMIGGVSTAGVTGDLDMDYNVGPSSWDHAGVLIQPDGAHQMIKYAPDFLVYIPKWDY